MFQRILVPTDLTERAATALDLAFRLASDDSRLTLLHVIEPVRGLDFDEMQPFYQKLERKAQARMAAAIERLASKGPEIVVEIVYGDRVEQIVQFAALQQVDLIVLASHKLTPSDAKRGWGTISYKVGILAPCPVLLVK